MKGKFCPYCGESKKGKARLLDKDLVAANLLCWRPEYDFSTFVFVNSSTKSTVVCRKHGAFQSSYGNIKAGHGCPTCKAERSAELRSKPPSAALAELQKAAPHLDFSKFNYFGCKTKSTVGCKEHGEFQATYGAIIRGRGCPKCGVISRTAKQTLSQEEALSRMTAVMPSLDFSKFIYKGASAKGVVVCPVHGEFLQPYNHIISGVGCKLCSFDRLAAQNTIPFDVFLSKARDVHGDAYEYDQQTYSGTSGLVLARCPSHGPFVIRCFDHINGQRCPECKDVRFNPNKRAVLYIYRLTSENETFVGYGVTANLRRRHEEHVMRCAQQGVIAELLHRFRFRKGFWCRHVESEIGRAFRPVDVGVRGFKREAAKWDDYGAIYSLAAELHQGFGKISEIFLP